MSRTTLSQGPTMAPMALNLNPPELYQNQVEFSCRVPHVHQLSPSLHCAHKYPQTCIQYWVSQNNPPPPPCVHALEFVYTHWSPTCVKWGPFTGCHNSPHAGLWGHAGHGVHCHIHHISASLRSRKHGCYASTGSVMGVHVDGDVWILVADGRHKQLGSLWAQQTGHVLGREGLEQLDQGQPGKALEHEGVWRYLSRAVCRWGAMSQPLHCQALRMPGARKF